MKKTVNILICIFVVVCSSCVSKESYNDLEYQYSQLEEEMHNVEGKYTSLISKYNNLVEEYNSLLDNYNESVSDNNWNRMVSQDKDRRLNDLLDYANAKNDRISELEVILNRIKVVCNGRTDDTSIQVNYLLRDYR